MVATVEELQGQNSGDGMFEYLDYILKDIPQVFMSLDPDGKPVDSRGHEVVLAHIAGGGIVAEGERLPAYFETKFHAASSFGKELLQYVLSIPPKVIHWRTFPRMIENTIWMDSGATSSFELGAPTLAPRIVYQVICDLYVERDHAQTDLH